VLPTTRLPMTSAEPVGAFQEVVQIFGLRAGATLPVHNDGINTRVEILMGLMNSRGSLICVAEDCRSWEEDGDIFAFDISFDHSVKNPTQNTRWVVCVGASHPQYEERFSLLRPRPNLVHGDRHRSIPSMATCVDSDIENVTSI